MSGPTYIVIPAQADGATSPDHNTERIISAIEQSRHRVEDPGDQQQTGPLREIISHQDSLYKYISWEDPIRTFGLYFVALSILFGTHYLPLTQFALKAVATALGVISVTELTSRSFGPNTVLTRLRPKEYKKFPEQTLNATLKDIHDFVQHLAVLTQRIIFGQDLGKAFGAFFGITAVTWLNQIIPAFWLMVLGLTTVFVAPLVISSRGRKVTNDVLARGGGLASSAIAHGKERAQHSKDKATKLASNAQDMVMDTGRGIGNMGQSGKSTAVDSSTSARDRASDISGDISESMKRLPTKATSSVKPPDNTDALHGHPKQWTSGDATNSATSAASKVLQLSNSSAGPAKQLAPGDNITNSNGYPDNVSGHL